jgi:glutaredoxin-like YruB-family protein
MKGISNINNLREELKLNDNVWLLLYKKGSEQSNCAYNNFVESEAGTKNNMLLNADVNRVRDIHPEYKITSVPTLLNFEKGELKNIIKGCHTPEQLKAIFEKASFVAANSADGKPQKTVTVYTTPTCTWCTTVKRHLQENGIKFREVDVSADQKAAEAMVQRSGQQGVPQTDINGEMIVGFDKPRINRLLGIN